MTWMWTGGGGGPPDAYIDLVLMRDVFHCTPVELESIPEDQVMMALEMHSTDLQMQAKKRKAAAEKSGRGKPRRVAKRRPR